MARDDIEVSQKQVEDTSIAPNTVLGDGDEALLETGHVQELARNFSLWSLAGTGLLVCNTWPALGGSILVAIYNGGPPGVLYEFIVASCFYFMIAASLAELASAMPSSAGPYLWASVTPGKRYGRSVGFLQVGGTLWPGSSQLHRSALLAVCIFPMPIIPTNSY